jgi:hypothetical protein
MNGERIPALREDITIDVHTDADGTQHLLLNDDLGLIDAPILLELELLEVLELLDGIRTWGELRKHINLEDNEAQWLRFKAFLGELDRMGFLATDSFDARLRAAQAQWDALDVRPSICAGSSIPSDEASCNTFFAALDTWTDAAEDASCMLIPHLDVRVAPELYGPAISHLRASSADLFVIVGTAHYPTQGYLTVTKKHFATPMGIVEVDRDAVDAVVNACTAVPVLGRPTVAPTDHAHRPEHSVEYLAMLIRYACSRRDVRIVPIVVSALDRGLDQQGAVAQALAEAVARHAAASGQRICWLISGDLAHVGMRFGDDAEASSMLDGVRSHDRAVVAALVSGDVGEYRRVIDASANRYRICGHAPTWIGLGAAGQGRQGPLQGKELAYTVWDDADTASAVTATTMVFT